EGRGFESRPRYRGRPGRRTWKSPAIRPTGTSKAVRPGGLRRWRVRTNFVPIFGRDQNLPPPATPGKGPLGVASAAKYPMGLRASSDRIKLALGSDDGAVGAERTRDQVARTR